MASNRFVRALRGLCLRGAIVVAGGCTDARAAVPWSDACQALGICDAPTLPAVAIDDLCDPSNGSSCSWLTLDETLSLSLRYAVDRPSSKVRLWILGSTLGETRMVGEQTVPSFAAGAERARHAQAERFIATARTYFRAAVGDVFERPAIRRSPLAEAITKIAVADAGGLSRELVVVSDAREFSSLGDWECRPLPTDVSFRATLHRQSVLGAGLLTGVRVQFVHVEAGPIPSRGCAVRLDRELRVRALWDSALRGAGVTSLRIDAGPARFNDPSNTHH